MSLIDQMRRERESRGGGRVVGLYRGIVTNVNDPAGLGRVRASVHELFGETDETDWASPCVPLAGGGAGMLMLPAVNDPIWIAFEAGDLSRPVWLGGWYSTVDPAPESAGANVRMIRSKAGHRIVLDDTEGAEAVKLSHANGAAIEMDAAGNITVLEAGGKVRLSSGTLKRLVNEAFRDIFNNHTHPYQNGTPTYGWGMPPAGATQAPSTQLGDGHLTERTVAG